MAAFAAFLIPTVTLLAQPTLTSANMTPAAGETVVSFPVDPAGINPGPAGANVNWDFSQHSTAGTSYAVTNHLVSGSQYQGQFSNATHYSTHDTDNTKSFSIFNSTEWSLRASVIDGGPTFDYSDPQKFLSFPFTFNSTFTDTYAATFTSGVPFNRQGSISAVADGYGTIILPGGTTVNGVLRMKVIDQSTDYMGATPAMTSDYDNYYWLKPGHKAPVFLISTLTSSASPQPIIRVLSSPPSLVGVEDAAANETVQVYPNPAKGIVTVRTGFHKAVSAILINSLGQEISRQMVAATKDQFSLEGISSEVYFLQLSTGESTVTRNLVVE